MEKIRLYIFMNCSTTACRGEYAEKEDTARCVPTG